MAEDTRLAVNHLVDLIAPALKKRKEERVELDRNTKNYWNKLKTRIPEDVAAALEDNPSDEAAQNKFKDIMEETMDRSQNVKMSTAIFLAKNDIEL